MDKRLLALSAVFFVAFLLFVSAVVFDKPLTQLTRAKEETLPSGENSLLFAWPLTAKADGSTPIKVNVFVRSRTKRLISGKTVTLTTTLGNISPASSISDKNGETAFTVTSTSPGTAEITGTIDNSTPLQKTLTVKFE